MQSCAPKHTALATGQKHQNRPPAPGGLLMTDDRQHPSIQPLFHTVFKYKPAPIYYCHLLSLTKEIKYKNI